VKDLVLPLVIDSGQILRCPALRMTGGGVSLPGTNGLPHDVICQCLKEVMQIFGGVLGGTIERMVILVGNTLRSKR
jgi:hypothetical protein